MKSKCKPQHPFEHKPQKNVPTVEEIIDKCIRKGLIEKTPYGYIFTPEFFETLEIYDD